MHAVSLYYPIKIIQSLLCMAKSLFYMVPDWEKYIRLAYGLQNDATHAGL